MKIDISWRKKEHPSDEVLSFVVTVALSLNVLRVQIDLHFTKVQEILFKNFCSLAPVAIAVRSFSELQI